jgi:hypothetical protein
MTDEADLENELRALGRTLIIDPPTDDLAERVLARIQAEQPGPIKRIWQWLIRSRRRLVAVIIAAVIIALGLTPPVRAAVLDWLRIGGVVIKTGPPPATSASPTAEPPPGSGPTMSIPEAQRLVEFRIAVPEELGPPDYLTVSGDRRVVSMQWATGAARLHLDQFEGTLSWVFVKQYWEDVTPARVSGREAVWLGKPHPITYVDRTGTERTEQARIAGPSLVWQGTAGASEVTLRLEGAPSLDRALAIAESAR